MIDLAEARALAERARENTSDGLTAREALPNVVDALLGMLGEPQTEWGAAWSNELGSGELPRDGEQDAREFIASMPSRVRHHWHLVTRMVFRHHWHLVTRMVYRHETAWVKAPAETGANDA